MARPLPLLAAAAFALACAPAAGRRPVARVRTGLDVLEAEGFAPLRGKRVGLITNPTGRDASGRSAVERLGSAPGVTLAALFSPEHGFTGVSEEARISSSSLSLGGRVVPIYSLYSGGIAGMRPKPEQLAGLDALVFDVQDIGARFYTYLATMGMAMEEAAKAGVEFYVLDRPNPINGVTVEGPVLDDLSLRLVTPTAYFAVPIRHGMTAGEIARLHNADVGAKLTVVAMKGWKREMWYDDTGLPWTPPSPNIPDLDAATLYPGIGIFEASNVAVGRGTPLPFRWIGAPWLDASAVTADARKAPLAGIRFDEQDYTPTKSLYAGTLCHGVRMTITDRDALRPVAVFRALEDSIRRHQPKDLVWRWDEAKRMVGTDRFRQLVESGADAAAIEKLFDGDAAAFKKKREPFLLYP